MEHHNRCPKLAESIVEIWEAILHTLLVNVTCRGFQFCILALEPMDAFVHAFKCRRHCSVKYINNSPSVAIKINRNDQIFT